MKVPSGARVSFLENTEAYFAEFDVNIEEKERCKKNGATVHEMQKERCKNAPI